MLASPFDLSPFFNLTKYHFDNGTGKMELTLKGVVSLVVLQILAGCLLCCKISLEKLVRLLNKAISQMSQLQLLLNGLSSLRGSEHLIRVCFTYLHKTATFPIQMASVLAFTHS